MLQNPYFSQIMGAVDTIIGGIAKDREQQEARKYDTAKTELANKFNLKLLGENLKGQYDKELQLLKDKQQMEKESMTAHLSPEITDKYPAFRGLGMITPKMQADIGSDITQIQQREKELQATAQYHKDTIRARATPGRLPQTLEEEVADYAKIGAYDTGKLMEFYDKAKQKGGVRDYSLLGERFVKPTAKKAQPRPTKDMMDRWWGQAMTQVDMQWDRLGGKYADMQDFIIPGLAGKTEGAKKLALEKLIATEQADLEGLLKKKKISKDLYDNIMVFKKYGKPEQYDEKVIGSSRDEVLNNVNADDPLGIL